MIYDQWASAVLLSYRTLNSNHFHFWCCHTNWALGMIRVLDTIRALDMIQTSTWNGRSTRTSRRRFPPYELLRGTLGLRRKLAVPVKNPTPIPIPHSETEPQHVVTDSDPLVASSVHRTLHRTRNKRVGVCARNSQREGRSLSRHVGVLFLSGDGVWCGVLHGDCKFLFP